MNRATTCMSIDDTWKYMKYLVLFYNKILEYENDRFNDAILYATKQLENELNGPILKRFIIYGATQNLGVPNQSLEFFLQNLGLEDKEELRPFMEKMTILCDNLENLITTNDLSNHGCYLCHYVGRRRK